MYEGFVVLLWFGKVFGIRQSSDSAPILVSAIILIPSDSPGRWLAGSREPPRPGKSARSTCTAPRSYRQRWREKYFREYFIFLREKDSGHFSKYNHSETSDQPTESNHTIETERFFYIQHLGSRKMIKNFILQLQSSPAAERQ